jgi:type I pantothenate kinase
MSVRFCVSSREIKAGSTVQGAVLFAPDLRRAARRIVTIDRPDILIFEGINVLQVRDLPEDGKIVPFVSDYFDFSIYIDAEEDDIHKWYVDRFMNLRQTAFRDPESFFHRYSRSIEDAARGIAERLWENINLKNLRQNILPTRPRADLILRKAPNHLIEQVRCASCSRLA